MRGVSGSIWFLWVLVSVFYAFQYILRVLPNILMPDIMSRFHIDAVLFGQLSGWYYIGYALIHIPVGLMLDHWGPKRVIPVCLLLTVVGLLPLMYSDHWMYPLLGRVLIGIGSSAAVLGCFKVIRMGFPEDWFTRILGLSATIGLCGAIYGGKPVAMLFEQYGFDKPLWGLIATGVGLAALIYFTAPQIEKVPQHTPWEDIKLILSNKKFLFLSFLGGCMVGPVEGFADAWGASFLQQAYGLEKTVASNYTSQIFVGFCFGAPFLTFFADKFKAYLSTILFSALIMGGIFTTLLIQPVPVAILPFLFTVIGVFCAYQMILIYKASTFVETELAGLATACTNMIIMIFGYLFHSGIGTLMDMFWDGTMVDGHIVYTQDSFFFGLGIIPAGMFLAALGVIGLAVQEKKKRIAA